MTKIAGAVQIISILQKKSPHFNINSDMQLTTYMH